jgi:GTP cyclohydrolase III
MRPFMGPKPGYAIANARLPEVLVDIQVALRQGIGVGLDADTAAALDVEQRHHRLEYHVLRAEG